MNTRFFYPFLALSVLAQEEFKDIPKLQPPTTATAPIPAPAQVEEFSEIPKFQALPAPVDETFQDIPKLGSSGNSAGSTPRQELPPPQGRPEQKATMFEAFSPELIAAVLASSTNKTVTNGEVTFKARPDALPALLKSPQFAADKKRFREIVLANQIRVDPEMAAVLELPVPATPAPAPAAADGEFKDMPQIEDRVDPRKVVNASAEQSRLETEIQAFNQDRATFSVIQQAMAEANALPEVREKVRQAEALARQYIASHHPQINSNYLHFVELLRQTQGTESVNFIK